MTDRITATFRRYYGQDARFRDGQYDAVANTLCRRRTLIVQRTGWGKSLVYFLCAKLLREDGEGAAFVVSPLVALMDNQTEAARAMDLNCDTLNAATRERRADILAALKEGRTDLVFVTPETLFSDDVQHSLPDIRIGMFVIDEAHCISDWGHDFRLDYSELKKVIALLPPRVPVLATTATANDRVVEDLKRQLGGDVYISRGPLMRDSLAMQVLRLPDAVQRFAWIADHIGELPGTGIVYCLTRRDCDRLTGFLQERGIKAASYYSRQGEEERNDEALSAFSRNEIKAIVSTVKLGMGYDKGDIGFVIHYQMPANIVAYYQQIGRAGRKLDRAFAILLCGEEDETIHNYFIDTAFPAEEECELVLRAVGARAGVSLRGLTAAVNLRDGRIKKTVDFLLHEGAVYRDEKKYYLSPRGYRYNREHYEKVTQVRRREFAQMRALTTTKECYLKHLVNCLDDRSAQPCGKCANCLGSPLIGESISPQTLDAALSYLDHLLIPIRPRKRRADEPADGSTVIAVGNREGVCLSKYGEAGYGRFVREDKYRGERFRDELIRKSAKVLKKLAADGGITHLAFVPSLRSGLVKDLAVRLADACGLQLLDVLIKSAAPPQKEQQNSAHQCRNAYTSFGIAAEACIPYHILLIDDIVDSGWTLTACGQLLRERGALSVTPFALADSSEREGS